MRGRRAQPHYGGTNSASTMTASEKSQTSEMARYNLPRDIVANTAADAGPVLIKIKARRGSCGGRWCALPPRGW